jgi:spermidine/putrescine transport system substrate-binding protein
MTLFHKISLAAICAVSTAMIAMPSKADPQSIMYMTFSGYEEAMFHADYAEKYGGSPSSSFFSDEHEAIAKLSAGFTADVAHVCTDNLPYWIGHDLLEPLDKSKLAHWNNVLPALKNIETVETDGKLWMVPWDWGFTSVIYRTDIVNFDEESFDVLLDPAYAGKVSIQDSLVDVGPTVAMLSGAKDPFALTESEIGPWTETLQKLKEQTRFFWSDPSALHQALASGEIVAAMGWPDTAAGLKDEGAPVEMMIEPKEGMLTWVCGLALVKNGSGPKEQAYDLINAMTAKASGKALVEEFYLATSNSSVYGDVDPAHLKNLHLDDVDAKLAGSRFYEPVDADLRQRLLGILEEVKAGL